MNSCSPLSKERSTSNSAADRDTNSGDNEPLVSLHGLKKYYSQDEGFLDRIVGDKRYVRAVDGVDLELYPGETVAVVGESGCGKSTLGRTILNLEEPTEGSIIYEDTDISGLSDRKMRPYRRDMQMVFQDPLASLNPRQKVGSILKAPMEVHDIGESDEDRLERAKELLERVGLDRSHVDRFPHQFSGGQQQRIAIARALTLEPNFMVADEPTSALDVSVQAQILNLLEDLQSDFGVSMLFITHDLSVVRQIADRVAVMYLGKIVETAPTDELFQDPQHPYTKALLSAVPRISTENRTERTLLTGTVPSPVDPPTGCRFHTRCPEVIPPDSWTGDQVPYRAILTFRDRLRDGKIDAEAAARRIDSDKEEDVIEYIIEQSLPCDIEELPPDAQTTVREATRTITRNEEGEDELEFGEEYNSPCEERVPEQVTVSTKREAYCHRVDQNDSPETSE